MIYISIGMLISLVVCILVAGIDSERKCIGLILSVVMLLIDVIYLLCVYISK